jgi:hypothetical protein
MFIKEIAYNFLCVSLLGFGIRAILASWNEFSAVPLLFILWNSLRITGVRTFFYFLNFYYNIIVLLGVHCDIYQSSYNIS